MKDLHNCDKEDRAETLPVKSQEVPLTAVNSEKLFVCLSLSESLSIHLFHNETDSAEFVIHYFRIQYSFQFVVGIL